MQTVTSRRRQKRAAALGKGGKVPAHLTPDAMRAREVKRAAELRAWAEKAGYASVPFAQVLRETMDRMGA
jgi:hypothetical protein